VENLAVIGDQTIADTLRQLMPFVAIGTAAAVHDLGKYLRVTNA
jgi:hypothetical protein